MAGRAVMNNGALAALVLAAGFSSRLGGAAKALRLVGGLSMLERVTGAFRRAGVQEEFGVVDVRVVTGHQAAEVAAAAHRLGARPLHNPDFAQGMFSSLLAGLRELYMREPGPEAVFVMPVDAALVLPRSVEALQAAWGAERERVPEERRVLLPEFLDQPGHPVLLPESRARELFAWSGEEGLRGYLRSLEPQEECLLRLPLADAGLCRDLDTPADCAWAEDFLRETAGRTRPALEEAWHLLAHSGLPEVKIRHSLLVGLGAYRLVRAVATASPGLVQPEWACCCLCGGLLHDLLRAQPKHARAAARLLEAHGWPEVARIVGVHHELPHETLARLQVWGAGRARGAAGEDHLAPLPAAAVCLADKYVRGDALGPLAGSFAASYARFGDNPEARANIERREKMSFLLEAVFRKVLSGSAAGAGEIHNLAELLGRPLNDEQEARLGRLVRQSRYRDDERLWKPPYFI